MISETAATWGIVIFGLLGIIYFIVVTLIAKIQNKDKLNDSGNTNQMDLLQGNTNYEDDEKQALVETMRQFQQFKNQNAIVQQDTIDAIHQVADLYFIRQSTFMLVFALACWLIFYLSFSAKYSIFWSLVSLVYGLVVIALVAFIILKLSINGSVKFLGESMQSRGKGYSYGWGVGSAIGAGVVSITLFLYNDLIPTALYFSIDSDKPTQEQLVAFYFCMMGFVWGVLSGAVFYRQVGSEVGRGLNTGSDMIGTYKQQHIFDIQTQNDRIIQQGRIFGNVIGATLTNVLDYIVIVSVLVLAFSLILVESSEINMATYYFPSYAILLCILFQIILVAIAFGKRSVDDQYQQVTPATFNAKNNILQVILTNVLSALVLIVVPLWLFPSEKFNIGSSAYSPFFSENITAYNIVWCTETGLATQCLLVFLGEYFTSNAFTSTKEVSYEQMRGAGGGLSQAYQLQAIGQGLILISIGVSIMICHLFAGFLGIACGLVGLLSTPVLLITITFFSGFAHDGSLFAKIQGIPDTYSQNVRSFAKGAQNYQIYLQMTNSTAVFYLDIVLIGLMSFYSKVTEVEIWDAFTIFGIFLGGAMAYLLKGSSNTQVTQTAKQVREDDVNNTLIDFKEYIQEKFAVLPVVRVIVHLVGCFLVILILAWLFGSKTVFGYIIGLNLIGIHLAIYSVLLYNCSKNARNLNQEIQHSREALRRNQTGMQNSVECDVATSNTESNGLLMYLVFNTLFVMMGGLQYWNTWGNFGKYLSEERTGISESSVGIWDWLGIGNDDNEAKAEE